MKNYFKNLKEKMFRWAVSHVESGKADFWLGAVSFSEASFFLVPPDLLLIAILSTSAQRWFYYASLTTIFSVLGGFLGYLIGAVFFDVVGKAIIDFYDLQSQVDFIGQKFSDNAFLAIFVSAFTPIPYKLFTISAGFFKINFIIFGLASLFGRGMRFFLVAFFMHKFGKKMTDFFFRYFDILSVVLILIIIAIFYLF